MDDYEVDAEQLGVATALEHTCALEARLRQAIQDTHIVSRDFQHDAGAADREHDALLAIINQLERLEEKLRDYSTIDSGRYEDKTVALSQLDSLRRELINVAADSSRDDAVREVQAFAEMRGDAEFASDSDSESEMTYDLDGTGSEVSSATEVASPTRPHGSTAHSREGSMDGDAITHPEERQPPHGHYGSKAALPLQPHVSHPADVSAPGLDRASQELLQYQSAADRIVSGRPLAGKAANVPVADRILLGDMPGSPEPESRPVAPMRRLRLEDSPSPLQAQRSASVQAPVTPRGPAAHGPPRGANADQAAPAGASAGGWVPRMRDMWRGSPAQQPTHPRHDAAASSDDSGAAEDSLRFGGSLDVAGMAARPAQASPGRAQPSMPQVQDTSAGGNSGQPKDAASKAFPQHGAGGTGGAGAWPRGWQGALAALASVLLGATAITAIQGQGAHGERSRKLPATDSRIGVQAGRIKNEKAAGQFLMSLPDVNLGRG